MVKKKKDTMIEMFPEQDSASISSSKVPPTIKCKDISLNDKDDLLEYLQEQEKAMNKQGVHKCDILPFRDNLDRMLDETTGLLLSLSLPSNVRAYILRLRLQLQHIHLIANMVEWARQNDVTYIKVDDIVICSRHHDPKHEGRATKAAQAESKNRMPEDVYASLIDVPRQHEKYQVTRFNEQLLAARKDIKEAIEAKKIDEALDRTEEKEGVHSLHAEESDFWEAAEWYHIEDDEE